MAMSIIEYYIKKKYRMFFNQQEIFWSGQLMEEVI
jgi:hypothetical protein